MTRTREENAADLAHETELARQGDAHEYEFDVQLYTQIRVRADSEEQARELVRDHVDMADVNIGAWPNGDPILSTVSMDDDELPLLKIDGEDPNAAQDMEP